VARRPVDQYYSAGVTSRTLYGFAGASGCTTPCEVG
jgi:hypothetical protein